MPSTPFIQSSPVLGNQYGDDSFLRAHLQRRLPAEMLAEIEPSLAELGESAGGELYRLQLQDRLNEQAMSVQSDGRLAGAGRQALAAVEHVSSWLSHNDDPRRLQAHARRVAMTLGRALELALLVEAGDVAAACRFAASPVDLLVDINSEDSARLIE